MTKSWFGSACNLCLGYLGAFLERISLRFCLKNFACIETSRQASRATRARLCMSLGVVLLIPRDTSILVSELRKLGHMDW